MSDFGGVELEDDQGSWVDLIAGSGLFDRTFYEGQAGRSFQDAHDAVLHWIAVGSRNGWSPSSGFDPSYYGRTNPDIPSNGVPSIIHFIRHGRSEGRKPKLSHAPLVTKPMAPSSSSWAQFARSRPTRGDEESVLDIIIPVYRGYNDTLACIYSVLSAVNETCFDLIVINDCGPEPALTEALSELDALGLLRLITNEANLGFVGSVNKGMALHPDRDVLLLNSDTIVYGAWLDRMRRHALSDKRMATVTAMSNNATILSYPVRLENNNSEMECSFQEIDALFASLFAGRSIEIPTGVGFCFYISRACLNEIGFFDVDAFGKGYGEENDFCMRAAAHGWLNTVALDVFVRHTGEVSFSQSAMESKARGLEALTTRWPDYLAGIHKFIANDPLVETRAEMDLLRLRRLGGGRSILFVEHGWGGGITRHLDDLGRNLADEGVLTIRAVPVRGQKHALKLIPQTNHEFPNLPNIPLADRDQAIDVLSRLGLAHVHVHSLVSYEYEDMDALVEIIASCGLQFDFTVHDYSLICPRITMTDRGGSYCASPSVSYCKICIERDGTEFGQVNIEEWRQTYASFVSKARRVFVPDQDVSARVVNYIPEIMHLLRIRPHYEGPHGPVALQRHAWSPAARPRRIAIIGAIGPHKGSRVLLAVAVAALVHAIPIEFVLFGYADLKEIEEMPNITVTGRYEEAQIDEMLRRHPCDLAFFPSVWPETYCYALTIAFRNGIFPVTFDLGAQARRVKQMKFGSVLPLDTMYDAEILARKLFEVMVTSAPASLPETIDRLSEKPTVQGYYEM